MPARTEVMPSFLRANNRHQTPIAALVATTIAVQLLLLVTLVVEDALDFMLKLDTSLTLIPYLLAAAYALKLTMTGETYASDDEDLRERRKQRLVALLAVVYSLFLLYSAGPKYLLVGCVIYAPGTLLYLLARRERGERAFTPVEGVVCALLIVAAVSGVALVATGTLVI